MVKTYFNGTPMRCESEACVVMRQVAAYSEAARNAVATVKGKIGQHYRDADADCLGFALPKDGSVLFFGPVGRGKTYAAASYAIRLAETLEVRNAHWESVPMFLMRIRETFGEKAKTTEAAVVNAAIAPDLLVLDDLGAEKVSDFSMQALYCVISERMNRGGRTTVVTTNLSLAELEAFDRRLFSRMASWHKIRVDGSDRRIRSDRRGNL